MEKIEITRNEFRQLVKVFLDVEETENGAPIEYIVAKGLGEMLVKFAKDCEITPAGVVFHPTSKQRITDQIGAANTILKCWNQ